MDIVSIRRENLRRWVELNGTPAKERSLFSQLKADGSFGERVARRLEDQYGMGVGYLDRPLDAGAELALIPGARPVAAGDLTGDPTHTPIRKYKEIHLRAGSPHGFAGELDQRANGLHHVPTRWLERKGYNPLALFAIDVKGESMQDTFYDGDTVVINSADKNPVNGDFYAVNVQDEALVKRLVRRGPLWMLSSDNPDKNRYPDMSIQEAQGEIIGRVVYRSGGM